MQAAIDRISFPSSTTYTAKGLELVRDKFVPNVRKDVRSVVILITDGKAHDKPGPIAEQIRAKGVSMYALGVVGSSDTIPFTELALSASSPSKDYVFEATFAQLNGLVERISTAACPTRVDEHCLLYQKKFDDLKYEAAVGYRLFGTKDGKPVTCTTPPFTLTQVERKLCIGACTIDKYVEEMKNGLCTRNAEPKDGDTLYSMKCDDQAHGKQFTQYIIALFCQNGASTPRFEMCFAPSTFAPSGAS